MILNIIRNLPRYIIRYRINNLLKDFRILSKILFILLNASFNKASKSLIRINFELIIF